MADGQTPSGDDDTADDPKEAQQSGLDKFLIQIRDRLVPALTTALGFAGLVAFIGGITMWSRFYAVQVPPEQAVDAMPDPELVVTGAVAMVAFGLAGLLAMAVAYILDRGGRQTEGMAQTLLLLGAIGGLVACVIADQNNARAWFAAGAVVLAALAIRLMFGLFGKLTDDLPPTDEERAAAEAEDKWPDAPTEGLRRAQQEAAEEKAKRAARTAKRARKAANRRRRKQHWYRRWLIATHAPKPPEPLGPPKRFRLRATGRWVVVGITIACAVVVGCLLGEVWLGVAIVLAFGFAWANYAVADGTGASFAWYGVSLFFAVVLYSSYLSVADTVDDPKIQPAAVVRMSDLPGQGVLGIYVTENKDRVYLATVSAGCGQTDIRSDSGRLFWIPKADVRAASIGRLQDVDDAAAAAPEMLQTLAAARVPGPPAPEGTATPANANPTEKASSKVKTRSMNAKSNPGKSKKAADRANARRRPAAELDDESDPGDSPKSEAADAPAPAPAVRFAPTIHNVRIKGVPKDAPSTGRIAAAPGDYVVVEGKDFGSAPRVTVDDVRARVTSYPKSKGNSELEFRVPQKAESGRVEVRCGDTDPQELAVRHRPVPVVSGQKWRWNRMRLSARRSTDFDGRIVGYMWMMPGGDSERGKAIFTRRPSQNRPLDFELKLIDNSGLRVTMEIEARLQDGEIKLDNELIGAVEEERRPEPRRSEQKDR